jgi:hypothetical protein
VIPRVGVLVRRKVREAGQGERLARQRLFDVFVRSHVLGNQQAVPVWIAAWICEEVFKQEMVDEMVQEPHQLVK